MKRALNFFAATLVVSIGAFGGFGVQGPRSGTDEEAIRAVIVAITEAFNRHDVKAWTRVATADAELVTVRGETMNGVLQPFTTRRSSPEPSNAYSGGGLEDDRRYTVCE